MLNVFTGAGPDGVEEIKRHQFFSTIDWNVSVSVSPSRAGCVSVFSRFLSLTETVPQRDPPPLQAGGRTTR